MSTKIIRQGLSNLLNSSIIEILSDMPGVSKAVDLLKENFTFTAAEIAQNFQESYGYALSAISSGLAAPENQRGFWKSLFQANVKSEFSQQFESDYLLPFSKQEGFSDEKISAFRQTAIAQCQEMATLTLFQGENVSFSEKELASFVTANGTDSMTDLVIELVQNQQNWDKQVIALLQFKDLFGNALLFFLHEQLRKVPRFENTLAAFQREGLMVDLREVKNIVQSTESKLNQALSKKQFGEVAKLGQQLERLQKVESVTQTHYAQFLEFSQRFADWAQLVNFQLEEVLAALPELQKQLGGIKSDTEKILALLRQLMARGELSPQIKPRDELTQYSSANRELIKEAGQLLKRIPDSDSQYSRVVIGLGSIVSSQGDLKQAEALFIKAYQQANNDDERALSQFNLFQVSIRQQDYDKAFSCLEEAIKLDEQRYALHNIHTYRIKRILGAGGMGCVFLAKHRLKKKWVVIKCFWETRYGSSDALFKEAFLMADIAGEWIPKPLDCGFVDITQKRGYFISEYIEGAIDGEAWLKKQGKLDVKTGIVVGLQIAKGLQIAHDKGIFHLDLKPANILLSSQKKSDVFKTSDFSDISVKIIDFGLAKVAPSLGQEMVIQRSRSGLSLLAQAAVFGTMDYAPPEQQGVTRYGEPSAKSDVYAFGKTLYRLLTGESPQTLHPRRLADAPELFELLCDCVEIDPERRVDVVGLMKRLNGLISPISQPAKPVEKPIQPKQPRIVKIDKREWWNQLDGKWKRIFKTAIDIKNDPSDIELVKIVNLRVLGFSGDWNKKGKIASLEPLRALTNLQELYCSYNQRRDLEPLRALTNLQELDCNENQRRDLEPLRALTNLQGLYCSWNKRRDLEPLRALTNLQRLDCWYNQRRDLEPLRALTNLQELGCGENQRRDLEPLRALTNLQELYYGGNPLTQAEIDKFKKAAPNCEVKEK
jgi:serine/threonine protein kinase